MAIPWLIGGAVALLVAKLASGDDDNNSNDREQEERRRKEAEREREKNERNKKLETARENFAMRGESIGSDIAQSLQDWIEVNFEQSPAFTAKLNENVFSSLAGITSPLTSSLLQRYAGSNNFEHSIPNEQDISALIPISTPPFERIRENLKTYSNTYSVKLKQGVKLVEAGEEIEIIESELKQIRKLKSEISRLQSELSAKT